MSSKTTLISFETVNNFLLLKWEDNYESAIDFKLLRTYCPCANCAGETDVFGNIYKGTPQKMLPKSFEITGLQPVGYYALRPFWGDGHTTGIYSFEMLRKLSEKSNDEK